MPAAFNVANSPITSAGTLAVTAAGVASQYIRGDGALADFPTTGGGGSSVSYYLNGSVSQGTFVGNTYYEMNKTPVIGTGTDFTINANGYIAQFITDANDPASLLIPAGNWNVEMYFSASSNGGTPSFYVELYKYDGTTFTLLGSSSATPEGITNGTAIDIYYTSVGIPETVLTITDRIAIRVYVTHSGRTITLHTEDNHLSEIITTFSNGLTTLNGLTKQAQYFAVGSTGTDFAIVSSVDTHTFNLPTASASNRGALSSANWTTFNNKQDTITLTTTGSSGAATFIANTLNIPNYGSALSGYLPLTGGTLSTTNTSETLRIVNGGTGYALYVQSNSYFQGDVSFQSVGNSLLKTVSGLLTAAVAGTDYLTPTGSGAGLSGVVLTTTNQSIAGDKTFTGSSTFTGTGTGYTAITISATGSVSRGISVTSSGTSGAAIDAIGLSGANGLNSQANSGNSAIYGNNLGGGWGGNFTSLSGPGVAATSQSGVGGIFSSASANIAEFYGSGGSLKLLINTSGNLSNGTYTYTLPSATGTLALTSALSSYLPLSGGTLTGPLGGTSATFSGNVFAGGATGVFPATGRGLLEVNGTTNALLGLTIGNSAKAYFYHDGTNLGLKTYTGNITFDTSAGTALTIASTGAATFISSGNSLPSYIFRGGGDQAGAGKGNIRSADGGGANYWDFGRDNLTTGDFVLTNLGSSPYFRVATSTGAATFSSSVTATTGLTVGSLGSGSDAIITLANNASGSPRTIYYKASNASVNFTSTGAADIMMLSNGGVLTINNLGTGTVQATAGVLSVISDSKAKDKTGLFVGSALNAINKIEKPQYWNYNAKSELGESTYSVKQFGLFADDIHKALGEEFAPTQTQSVYDEETKETKIEPILIDGSISYSMSDRALLSLAIQAIQELKAEIDLLKGEPIIPTDNNLE
jgi:hypothetical protein